MNTQLVSLSFAPTVTNEGDRPRHFAGIAYSGGVIPRYGFLGDVLIDLATLKAPTKSVFALLNHDPSSRVGKCSIVNTGQSIEVSGTFSKVTTAGQQVAAEFTEDAPWEFSVGISAELEVFEKPKIVELNGYSFTVDAVLRDGQIREVSFVPAGADPNTRAIAFAQDFLESTLEVPMELHELKEKVESLTMLNADLQLKLTESQTEHERIIAELNVKLGDSEARLQIEVDQAKTLLQRVSELETELHQFKSDVRVNAVKALFADLNREVSEEAIQPYLSLSEEVFTVIAQDLRSLKPKSFSAELFREVATQPAKESASEASLAAQLFNQVAGVK